MKIILNGEAYDFDGASAPMSEAMAVERESGRSYTEWQSQLQAGALWAFCVLAWIVWRRDGRDVPLQDLLDGKIDFDLGAMLISFTAAQEAETAGEDPTTGTAPVPDGTVTTPGGTRRSSRKSSA